MTELIKFSSVISKEIRPTIKKWPKKPRVVLPYCFCICSVVLLDRILSTFSPASPSSSLIAKRLAEDSCASFLLWRGLGSVMTTASVVWWFYRKK